MTTALATQDETATAIEQVLIGGDLAKLTPEQRVSYYKQTCDSLGLNPLTRPFDYITLNGKLTLYARKDATDQLRRIHKVSINIVSRETMGEVHIVTARATLPDGRFDESTGATTVGNLKGDNLVNALLKAETKAKRRVTLSVVGLGLTDESEIETIPGAQPANDSNRRPARRAEPAQSALPESPLFAQLDDAELSLAEQQAAWAEAFRLVGSEEQRAQLRAYYKSKPRPEGLDFAVSAAYMEAGKRLKGSAK